MRKLVARLFAAFVLMSVGLAPLTGQTTGSIRGVVETSHTALPGVTVEAKSPNLQGTRSAVTDAEGRFNLTSLPPGQYTVTAPPRGLCPEGRDGAAGPDPGRGPEHRAHAGRDGGSDGDQPGRRRWRPSRMRSAGIWTPRPSRPFRPAAITPTSTQLASGVNTDNSNVRQQSFTVYGSTGLENAYMVDGANTTGVEIGSQGKVLNFEFIQEVELKAGGYEAEYTGAQGGILNVVTKSGGNEYHGDVFGYFDNDGLQANNKHLCLEGTGTFPNCTIQETPDGIPVGFTKQDYGVDVGGFILKDSLWFFGAYDHVRNTLQRQVTTGETAGTVADLDTTSNLYSAKLTWNFGQGQTLVGSVFGDPTDDSGAVGQLFGPPTTYDGTVSVGGTDFGARYQGILGPKWLVTGQFFYHRENANTLPGLGGNEPPVDRCDGRNGDRHRRLRRPAGRRSVRPEEVHPLRLPRGRHLLRRTAQPEGGLRVPAGRRRRPAGPERRAARQRPRHDGRRAGRSTPTRSSPAPTPRSRIRRSPPSSRRRRTTCSRSTSRTAGRSCATSR